ncbi:MAG: TIGR03960 family B12-binding radical SAM protein [Thermodesulfobacteriota bacterium]|nr:TIGR03960 family B12-binding radical SAM protein [Thermodesulfobacteriota bacterium]
MSWNLIEKTRETLEYEEGTIVKPWGGRITIAIVYPNLYHIGMSNLGFHTIYYHLNHHPNVLCERVFLPGKEESRMHINTNTALFTMESQKPLQLFDIVAFSISFENDSLNILKILDLAKIPLKREERDNGYPLIIAGGIVPSLNPEPISDFIDLFVIGEGEEILPEFVEAYREGADKGCQKEEILKSMNTIEGVYVPMCYSVDYKTDGTIREFKPKEGLLKKTKKRWVKRIDKFRTHSSVLTPNTEFGNMFLVEISRGCKWRCRFCVTGFICHPYRKRELENLSDTVAHGLKKREKIGLIGADISSHPDLSELCESITNSHGKVSFASLRADSLNDRIMKWLGLSGHKTISIAPEVGSERLRRVINKRMTEEDILEAVETVVRNDILNIKLYFLIGLPTETLNDVEEIIHITKRIKHHILKISKGKKRIGRLILSINSFVPKPFTPFQWHPFEDTKSLNNKLKIIRNGLKKEGNVHIISDLPKWSYVQSLLSRGDRRVGRIILSAYESGGDWKKSFQETDVNPDFYVYRQRSYEEIFPWDFIDHGTNKDRLFQEYQEALEQ